MHISFLVECFKATLSKGLGLGIIAGSILVKVPQIIKLLTSKSADGINLTGVLLDLFAITMHMSYSAVKGFPFSAWGDSVSLAIQTALIATLVFHYNGRVAAAQIFAMAYLVASYVLTSGIVPVSFLWTMQGFNVPVLIVGKLSQAYTNYKNKSTGQLSAATCFLLFAGSIARIFTSYQETGDPMLITTYIASTFANTIIVLQMLYYWNADKNSAKKQDKKKN